MFQDNFSYIVCRQGAEPIFLRGARGDCSKSPYRLSDGLALLRAVGRFADVKIVANDLLASFTQLSELLIPIDNMDSRSSQELLL